MGRLVQKVSGTRTFARLAPPIVTGMDRMAHRLSGGKAMASRGLMPMLMLTTIGARSGEPRTVPLACVPDGDVIYLIGSNFGREKHPAWSGNLLKHPAATVSFERRTFDVVAHHLSDEEKAAVWPQLTAMWPNYDLYVERSGRNLRVFRLERSDGAQPDEPG